MKNKRSLIHIDNMVSFVKMAVDKELVGLFFPQNESYVSTMELAKNIAKENKKTIYFSFILGIVIYIIMPFSVKVKKAFGNLIYKDTEYFDYTYCKERNIK